MKKMAFWCKAEPAAVDWKPAYRRVIRAAVEKTLETEGFALDGDIGITIVNARRIRSMNREHRGIDQETDVLSFPMHNPGDIRSLRGQKGLILGDLVIAADQAKIQAEAYGHKIERELGFLTVHGLLHLLGYDHTNDDLLREASPENIMKDIKINNDSTVSSGCCDDNMRNRQEEILEALGLRRNVEG